MTATYLPVRTLFLLQPLPPPPDIPSQKVLTEGESLSEATFEKTLTQNILNY